jgi:uncharacterized membrane protein
MNNHTNAILRPGLVISMGYIISVFSLLCILILIVIILFLFFTKQQHVPDEYELSTDRSTSISERRSFKYRRSKQSTSAGSFQMSINEQNTDSHINLVSSK